MSLQILFSPSENAKNFMETSSYFQRSSHIINRRWITIKRLVNNLFIKKKSKVFNQQNRRLLTGLSTSISIYKTDTSTLFTYLWNNLSDSPPTPMKTYWYKLPSFCTKINFFCTKNKKICRQIYPYSKRFQATFADT